MKNIVLMIVLLLNAMNIIAQQPPQRMNYQATVRDGSGNLVTSQPIGLRFNIRNLTATGTIVYQETQTVSTNAYAILTAEIGGGTPVIGTMTGIDWANGQKWMEVEIDITGGTSYTPMGAAELLSVPYSFYAGNTAGSLNNLAGSLGHTIYHDGTDWTNSNFLYNTGSYIGIGTTSPVARLHVADSSVVFTGSGGSLTSGVLTYRNPPISGAGSRMQWYADRSAFRSGSVTSTQWDNTNTGNESIAAGKDVTASGDGSAAFGIGTVANSYAMVALGSYNDVSATYDPVNWSATDQIFVVGNGTSTTSTSNAITVLKNGNVGIGTIAPSATLDVDGNFKLGNSGSVLNEINRTSVTFPLPAVGPDSVLLQTFSVPYAVFGSNVVVTPRQALPDGLVISYARVSATNTVEIKLYNVSSVATPGISALTWAITLIR